MHSVVNASQVSRPDEQISLQRLSNCTLKITTIPIELRFALYQSDATTTENNIQDTCSEHISTFANSN